MNIPKTKEECFATLDEMLSDEDKQAIIEMDDVFKLHFTLGMWIRNNWIYKQSDEESRALIKSLGEEDEEKLFYHPDDYSTIILEAYKKHLMSKI
ncbi:MAG: hypothetical protein IKW98_05995 [Prevotella sp.]|nr:hypothetical protein [Prevotella sp.]